jgi:T5SS/PEP-CTERM-associated repeat protein
MRCHHAEEAEMRLAPLPLAAAMLVATLPLSAPRAATLTWDGGGPSANWSALDAKPGPNFGRTNWSGVNLLPDNGDNFVFAGTTRLANTNDIAALTSIGSLSFAAGAGAFTLGGNGLAIAGALSNASKALQTLYQPLTLAGTDLSWDGGSGGIALGGGLTLGDHRLTLSRKISINSAASTFTVGEQAQAALTIAGGSSLLAGSIIVGRDLGSSGNLVVDGNGSRVHSASQIAIGSAGTGTLSISNGGLLEGGTLTAGGQGPFASFASIGVSGLNSALRVGSMSLGGGSVTMTVNGAAAVSSTGINFEGPLNELSVSGAGTSWHNLGALQVTNGSQLTLDGGAAFDNDNITIGGSIYANASVQGAGTQLTSRGSFALGGSGGFSRLTLSGGATLTSASATVSGPFTTAYLSGSGTRWNAGSLLQVGESEGWAVVEIDPGSTLVASALSIGSNGLVDLLGGTLQIDTLAVHGYFEWAYGTLKLTTPGSAVLGSDTLPWPGAALPLQAGMTLQSTNELVIGPTTLRVLAGGLVSAPRTTIAAGGNFELAGGMLQTDVFAGPGNFAWSSGTLRLTGKGGAALGSGLLTRVFTLQTGRRLEVVNDLQIGSGALLVLDGGQVTTGRLLLAGGSVVGLQPVDLADFGVLQGHGSVAAPLHGGSTATIRADGPLTLGDLASAQGFAFDGRLEVGSAQVLLLSSALATPGSLVTLGDGGQLASVNGLLLGDGRVLNFAGAASILGRFVNDGRVAGDSGTLSFLNDVSGSGSFAGHVVFHSGYSPGHSAASVDFGGGDAGFDAGAMLTLEVFGAAPGTGYDRLVHLDRLSFDGRLQLLFGADYALTAGTRLQLLDFESFAGSLAPDRIEVSGFDRNRLDFSRLAVDGSVLVTAVPEPATSALWLAALGLAAMVSIRRPRSCLPKSAPAAPWDRS